MPDGISKSVPSIPRDIRSTSEYSAVIEYYSNLFAPGSGLVHGTREIHPSPDGAIYAIGAAVKTLEQGPVFSFHRIDPACRVISEVREGGQRAAMSPDGKLAAVSMNGFVEILALGNDSTIAKLPVSGAVEQLGWSSAGELALLIAGSCADVSGIEGGFAMQPTDGSDDAPPWLPEVDTGDSEDVWRRIWIWDGEADALAPLTGAPLNVWEFSWSRDSAIVAVCSDHHGEASWYTSTLRLIDRANGASVVLHTPIDQFGKPCVAPDGRGTAFIEAVCSDRGLVCGSLKLLHDGSCLTLPTEGVQVTDVHWQTSTRLAFAGLRGVETVIGIYDLAVDAPTILWASSERTSGDFFPAIAVSDSHVWATTEGYASPPALQRFGENGEETLWSFGAQNATSVQGEVETIRWHAADGIEIEALLIRPEAGAVGLPLLVDIHGGPIWSYRNRWVARYRAAGPLVARGFAVLLVNPRGSAGRGQDFARHVVGDMGGADANDFLSGFDHLAEQGIIDPGKIVLTGSSYGGFMSSWLVTRDSRFAAAIPISPVTNWYSQHYGSQIPSFDEAFLDASPEIAGGRHFERSPIFHASKVTTPTLILSGALDKNTPPSQALEFRNALLGAGATSILCTYPDAGHSLRSYPAYLDSAARVMIWAEHFVRKRNEKAQVGTQAK